MLKRIFSSLRYSKIPSTNPVVIGGTGGSGTRVIPRILEQCHFFMGNELNISNDALGFVTFLEKTIPTLLTSTRTIGYSIHELPKKSAHPSLKEFKEVLLSHTTPLAKNRQDWGWKIPNIIYALPFIHHFYPNFYFIHVVRDGRDMAFSDNQNQAKKYYPSLFHESISTPICYSSIKLWLKVNVEAANWARTTLGNHYYLLRYEDLCANPENEIKRLLRWLNKPDDKLNILAQLVNTPATLGRWKQQDKNLIKELTEIAANGLTYFNYPL